jgi:ATP-dependent Clp protease ATP-binding subunit ClpB
MRLDKLTTKFQQALADAQSLAVGSDNPYIEPVHILSALIAQEDGGTASLLARAGVNVARLREALKGAIGRLPKVEGTGGEVSISRELTNLLNLTDKEAQKRGDEYIASEMFILALGDDKGEAGRLLKEAGGNKKALEQAVSSLRGTESVSSPEAEAARH